MEHHDAATSKPVTARSVGVRYGLFLGLTIIVYFLILTALNIPVTSGFGLWFKYVFIIGTIYMAHRNFKFNNGAQLEFGQGVSIAAWAGLIFGLLDGAFRYIYLKFIDLSFIEKLKEIQMAEMEGKGMSDVEIKQAASITGLFMNAEFIAFMVFISALLGAVIIGLILSLFTRNVYTRNS